MKRRTFLQTSSYLAVGTLLPARVSGCSKKQKLNQIGLQLYTIRDAMQRDSVEAIRRIADIGYAYVEGAGYSDGQLYGRSPRSFKAILDEYELTMPSGHIDWKFMKNDPERVAATCREVGQKYVVLPYWPEEKRTAEGYAELVSILNTAGEVCSNYGLQLAYHNHDFEFTKLVAGRRPMDMLLQEVDADLVQFELDLYWITRAGRDYQKYFREQAGRFPLWHVKDMDDTPEKYFAAVGSGVLDWPTIFNQQQLSGMEYFFVEQDHTRPGADPFKEIEKSYAFLEEMRF
jgi:sugar phosphate isomerase/epimerase